MHARVNDAWFELVLTTLASAGFAVGVFGKYLNQMPSTPPAALQNRSMGHEWLANGGGDYFSPSFQRLNGSYERFAEGGRFGGYSTAVIGNLSARWVAEAAAASATRPFFALVAPKAPHIQDGVPAGPMTQPAPWHAGAYRGASAPRTPNWNRTSPQHHWLVSQQPPMSAAQAAASDALFAARWESLLAFDDAVAAVVAAASSAARPTYFLMTSDHGYQLGQFRMPQGKWNVYETATRIPFLAAGPGIAAGSTLDAIASTVDLAPTVLELAGVSADPRMDGRSLVGLLLADVEPKGARALRVALRAAAGVRCRLGGAVRRSGGHVQQLVPGAACGERDARPALCRVH